MIFNGTQDPFDDYSTGRGYGAGQGRAAKYTGATNQLVDGGGSGVGAGFGTNIESSLGCGHGPGAGIDHGQGVGASDSELTQSTLSYDFWTVG